uniref:Methyl-CpG binding domain protein 1 n=1 Tax=Latimeria chalumnae TaxID=7897 RepID=H2ZZ78_LATCH
MSEGWEECPLLGPGWKRREALRRSGASFGKSDTYYMSPSGERFRSKIELVRFVGSTIDLTNFNFKLGILEDPTICSHSQDRKIRKRYRFSMDRSDLEPQPKRPKLSFSDSFDGVHLNGTVAEDTLTVCSSCNKWVSGVNFGKHKLSKWNCANCRAERRAFTKEQNFYKRYGCGVCNACLITEDCGYCVICSTKEKSPSEANPNWKCVSRRCLRVVRKRVGCGFCKGCQTTEDCGLCRACLKQKAHPEEEHPGKCLKRVCIKKLLLHCYKDTQITGLYSKKRKYSRKPGRPRRVPKNTKYSSRRMSRQCGECEACVRKVDCGSCDFCFDKPKFGGGNRKRQKCRWRQCLRYAMKKKFYSFYSSCFVPNVCERVMRSRAVPQKTAELEIQEHLPNLLFKITPLMQTFVTHNKVKGQPCFLYQKRERERKGELPCLIKEETCAEDVSEQIIPVAVTRAAMSSDVVAALNEEEAVDEGTPVITEIFSLGSYQAISKLDRVLQEFLLELNEIPLPALWEVLPPDGPDLKLVQRSSLSSMASTVVHIQPGLFFQVIVQDRLVPPGHELFANHPSHLTTVDDVVELICDLEAYQPCAGYAFASSSPPQQNVHSPACRVLVYKERCENCSAAANE